MYTRNEKIVPVYIEDVMRHAYLDYAMSVIISRALPDVRDGLKPSQRRIMVAMNDLSLYPGRPFRKCAKICGDTSGNYHPHGEQVVYPTLVRLAQVFNMRYPLIEGQGNFGSIDGDPPAAMRYTEARLSPIGMAMLTDLERETVEYVPNYDGTRTEPVIFPGLFPNLICNGSAGIAVGMATNMPPHNLSEIVDALVALIDNPELGIKDLLKIVKGPDFPTGAIIYGAEGIRAAYETGRGIIQMRAKANIETPSKGTSREHIVITELPYQVNKSGLIENIARLVQDKKLEGISDIRDESDKDGLRIVVELKRGEEPAVILNQLYKYTQMEETFGIIMLALVKNQPKVLNLKEIFRQFLNHRVEVIERRTRFELRQAEEKAHLLEGLKIALSNLEAVIKTIRSSSTVEEARTGLIAKFKLSEKQAQAILDMKLQRLTQLESKKIDEEYLELIKLIAQLKGILGSTKKIYGLIRENLLEIKKKFGDGRRTEIVYKTQELEIEDLITEEDMVIAISHGGYIKRMPVSAYRQQHRGGRGVTGVETKEEDFIEHLFIASTHHYILFFTNKGRIYWLKVHEIPQAGRQSKGRPIINLLSLSIEEKVSSFVPVKEFSPEEFLIMATEQGLIKKTSLIAYSHPRQGGIIGLTLNPKDNLIGVVRTEGQRDIILATEQGQAIRFSEKDVRDMGRAARGVRGIRLGKKDKVVGMGIVDDRATILTATENGYGKRTSFGEYRQQSRGGKGIINIKTTERNGIVVGIVTVTDKDEIMLITKQGVIIRTAVTSINTIGRNTQGVRLIRLDESDTVGAVAKVAAEEE